MEGQRRITLYEQMTANRRDSLASLFSNDVVLSQTSSRNSTTLLDIIKEEGKNKNTNDLRKSWKAFKHMLRLNRTEPVQSSTVHNNNNNRTLLSQFSQLRNDVVGEDSNNHHMPPDVAAEEVPGQTVGLPENMLVMDLLEETDQETVLIEESEYKMSDDEEEKSEVENKNWCCVCMVRDKGAAFIPCGHTFCRMCCREIWVSRGNCPLCNNSILEILHLF